MRASCRCGTTWTGARIEHCTACHQSFTGTTAGDKHRVGDHAVFEGPSRRRCLTPDEMLVKGLTRNRHDVWTTGGGFWGSGVDLGGPSSVPVDAGTQEGSQALRNEVA